MDKTKRMIEIIELALKVQNETKHAVDIHYFGNIDDLGVMVYNDQREHSKKILTLEHIGLNTKRYKKAKKELSALLSHIG